MQIAVCDDNELFLQEIKGQLTSYPIVENVFTFSDLEEFLLSVKGGRVYDAVLMDIDFEQDKTTGMDAAAELLKLCPKTKIIYATGNVEYSQQIFLHRANLSGFLTKPINPGLLQANLQKVIDAAQLDEGPSLMLKQGGTVIHIPQREICFIESKGHTIEVNVVTGEVLASYQRIKNIISSLSAGFFQCHKSYIVNMRQIRRFESDKIVLKSGSIIPVSRSKYNETRQAYFSFMGQTF